MLSPELKAQMSTMQDCALLIGIGIVVNILIYKMWFHLIYTGTQDREKARRGAFGMGWMSTMSILPIVYLLLFNPST